MQGGGRCLKVTHTERPFFCPATSDLNQERSAGPEPESPYCTVAPETTRSLVRRTARLE